MVCVLLVPSCVTEFSVLPTLSVRRMPMLTMSLRARRMPMPWRSLPVMGRLADAIDEMERATRLEPLSLGIRATLAWMYYLARDYDKAFNQAQVQGNNVAFLEKRFLASRCHVFVHLRALA